MELSPRNNLPGLDNVLIIELEKSGVADIELLKFIWKEHVSSDVDIHHLCLTCQAHCLIFPDQSRTKFVVPCKLPEKLRDESKVKKMNKGPHAVLFYFDFRNFLPDEIYHRLICLMISSLARLQHSSNQYSKQMCYFDGVLGTKWIIEKEEMSQRLKFVVM